MNGQRTPLAWKNLTHDWRKLSLAVSGIAFAVMLMFQQRGFNHALFDSTVELIRELDADLIVFNHARFALTSELRFERDVLDRIASVPGVDRAEPIYFENTMAAIRSSGRAARPIRVIGFEPSSRLLTDRRQEIDAARAALDRPSTAIIDRLSKEYFGFDLSPRQDEIQVGELANRRIEIAGTFSMGRDFAHEGNLIMSTGNFANYFPYRSSDPLEVVDLGLVQTEAGQSAAVVQQRLQSVLPSHVRVLTKQEFVNREIGFWSRSTPIGIIFAIGAGMGFVVGVIICYQILATDISEHFRELATLKAMGYSNGYFFQLVIGQAWLLALFGFGPGLAITWVLFQFNSAATGLLMSITWDRALFILFLTLLMCSLSGLFAIRKLVNADPASLF